MLSFAEQVKRHISAAAQILWIYCPGDVGRCERELRDILEQYTNETRLDVDPDFPEMTMYIWDVVNGASWDDALRSPLQALQALPNPGFGLFLLQDGAELLHAASQIGVRRELINNATRARYNGKAGSINRVLPVTILADRPDPPSSLRELVSVVDFSLPDRQMLRTDCVDYLLQESDTPDDVRDAFSAALLGLSSEEATRILAYSLTGADSLDEQKQLISEEKAKAIRKIEGLTYIPHEALPDISEFGGYGNYKDYLKKRKLTYTQHAQKCLIPRPRGVMLLGPPGTGKTAIASAGAKELGLDLLVLDLGAVYEGIVGGTEKKIRACLKTVEAMKNAYLVVDEIDKLLAGAHKNQTTDSGVSSRLLSYFLNWLSSRDMVDEQGNRTFVMITANRVDGLPPELLRPGRFDKVFSTDLPNAREAREILCIHLKKRGISPEQYSKTDLENFCSGVLCVRGREFSGAEIEEVVVSAQVEAYYEAVQSAGAAFEELTPISVQPDFRHLEAAAKTIIPAAKLYADDIKEIRAFCLDRTVPVSGRKSRK